MLSCLSSPIPTARLVVMLLAIGQLLEAANPPVQLGLDKRLAYAVDENGNRVPDFSTCGYRSGDQTIPPVPGVVRVRTEPTSDDTRRIQRAIDLVAKRKPDATGFRGAVVLGPGEFAVSGQLSITASGIVLRGQGAGDHGTTIRATGRSRRPLIIVAGMPPRSNAAVTDPIAPALVVEHVPVGSRRIKLDATSHFRVGQRVRVVHRSSKAWIAKMGGDQVGWRERTKDLRWERSVDSIHGDELQLDAALTLPIKGDEQISVEPFDDSNRITQIGVEDLCLISAYDHENPLDEEHAWFGVHFSDVRDAWIRRMQFRQFAGGAVMLGEGTARISVEDCASFDPVSEIGGYRRQTFYSLGQQCLFLRCWSEHGLHDFSVGHCAAGPNAFVNCYAMQSRGDSGPGESLAVGVLYDNVRIDGHDLNLMNRWNSPPKTGVSAINCMLWQCQAAHVHCDRPPIGDNWVHGVWATPAGDGSIEGMGDFVKPLSLFQQQVKDRLGEEAAEHVGAPLLKPVGADQSWSRAGRGLHRRLSRTSATTDRHHSRAMESRQYGRRPTGRADRDRRSTNRRSGCTASRVENCRRQVHGQWQIAYGRLLHADMVAWALAA